MDDGATAYRRNCGLMTPDPDRAACLLPPLSLAGIQRPVEVLTQYGSHELQSQPGEGLLGAVDCFQEPSMLVDVREEGAWRVPHANAALRTLIGGPGAGGKGGDPVNRSPRFAEASCLRSLQPHRQARAGLPGSAAANPAPHTMTRCPADNEAPLPELFQESFEPVVQTGWAAAPAQPTAPFSALFKPRVGQNRQVMAAEFRWVLGAGPLPTSVQVHGVRPWPDPVGNANSSRCPLISPPFRPSCQQARRLLGTTPGRRRRDGADVLLLCAAPAL